MKLKIKLWVVGLSLAAVAIWGGVNYFREQARLKREAQLQAERAALADAMAKSYVETRTPDEIAADEARKSAAARREAEQRAAKKHNEETARIMRDRAMRNAVAGAMAIKRSMKDPESFVLRAATIQEDGAVCFQYRGKNSFGATMPGRVVIDPSGKPHAEENRDSTFAAAWAVHCERIGEEVADALKRSGAI